VRFGKAANHWVEVDHLELETARGRPYRGYLRFKIPKPSWVAARDVEEEFAPGKVKSFADTDGMYTIHIESTKLTFDHDEVIGTLEGMICSGRVDADEWTIWGKELPDLEMWP
jgi:hypothetical protein